MLIRSISGIRGLVNEDLGQNTIIKYAHALHDYLQDGVIYVGRDSRPSGEEIVEIMINELIKLGRTENVKIMIKLANKVFRKFIYYRV